MRGLTLTTDKPMGVTKELNRRGAGGGYAKPIST